MLPPSIKECTNDEIKTLFDELDEMIVKSKIRSTAMVEDKKRSIETLIRHLAINQATVQEVKVVHAVITSLTQEAQDLNAGRENSTLRDWEQLDDNVESLTKIEQWTSESCHVCVESKGTNQTMSRM